MAAASSPSSAPAKKQKKWLRGNNKVSWCLHCPLPIHPLLGFFLRCLARPWSPDGEMHGMRVVFLPSHHHDDSDASCLKNRLIGSNLAAQIKSDGDVLIAMWRQLIHRYLGEARAALAAAAQDTEDGDDAAAAALGLVSLALEMSPRAEAALELRARALLTLRRYRDVADMLRDYIPSCGKSCSGDDATTSSSSSSCSSGSSGSGDLAAASRVELLSPDRDRSDAGAGAARFLCFDVSELKRRLVAGFSRNSNTEAQWR
jgi:hypothetical protein